MIKRLENSIVKLEKAIQNIDKNFVENELKSSENPNHRVIKNFKETYDLSRKVINQATYKNSLGNSDIDYIDLYKDALSNDLIEDAEKWIFFHNSRYLLSESITEEELDNLLLFNKEFLESSRNLLEKIKNKNLI